MLPSSATLVPDAEVSGRNILSVLGGLVSRNVATRLCEELGITEVDAEEWYSISVLGLLFNLISDELGPDVLFSLGYRMPSVGGVPPTRIRGLGSALRQFARQYADTHRGRGAGRVMVEDVGDGDFMMAGSKHYPCPFLQGYLEGLARRWGGTGRYSVVHLDEESDYRDSSDCNFRIVRQTRVI